jgi:hypothetical protein
LTSDSGSTCAYDRIVVTGEACPRCLVYAVVDDSLSPVSPLGESLDVLVRREDAERFIEEVRGDKPDMAAMPRIEERELEAGGLN